MAAFPIFKSWQELLARIAFVRLSRKKEQMMQCSHQEQTHPRRRKCAKLLLLLGDANSEPVSDPGSDWKRSEATHAERCHDRKNEGEQFSSGTAELEHREDWKTLTTPSRRRLLHPFRDARQRRQHQTTSNELIRGVLQSEDL